jgi:signal transduction histidine kinase
MVSFTQAFERYWQPALLSVAFLILVGIGVIAASLAEQADTNARQVADSISLQKTLGNLLLTIRRAESGQRGYVITVDRGYLDDYRSGETQVAQILEQIRQAFQGHPTREAELAQLRDNVAAKFDELDAVVELVDGGRLDKARDVVRTNRGRDLMVEISNGVTRMMEEEDRTLATRSQVLINSNRNLLYILLIGVALIVGIGVLAVAIVQRTNRARHRAIVEMESTNANLETIISHRTSDLTEANEEIQRFAYIVSHDLRSPLVNVMGFTKELDGLRDDLINEIAGMRDTRPVAAEAQDAPAGDRIAAISKEFDEALGFIKTSIAKMDRLINAILRLSREGRREFTPEHIDMKTLIGNIEKTLSHQASEKGTAINIGNLPPIESDRLALEQIFSNLMDNALKYLRPGTPGQIDIGGQETATLVTYEVRDNGRGIDPADHQRIFDLFRRAGPQDVPGEGIGLAHVRALVRRLGGYMGVSSEPGRGSIFTITLPKRFGTRGERKTA